MAIAEQMEVEKINFKIYSLVCIFYHFLRFCFWSKKCGIAANTSSNLLFPPLQGDAKMVVLRRWKPTEFVMRQHHQKRDLFTIYYDHT